MFTLFASHIIFLNQILPQMIMYLCDFFINIFHDTFHIPFNCPFLQEYTDYHTLHQISVHYNTVQCITELYCTV